MLLSRQDNPFLLYSQGGVMPGNLLLPKFLPKTIVRECVDMAVKTLLDSFQNRIKRQMFHIVVLVPAMAADNERKWPNYPLQPYPIFEFSYGQRDEWPHPFDEIAQCKALQLWHDRNDGGTDIMPHLLFANDTPFWGGVKRSGIVVTCSGLQPWFDRMLAGIIADMCIARAYDNWMQGQDRANKVDLLT